MDQDQIDADVHFDLFAWANRISQFKNDLDAEIFVVSKNFTVYHLPVANKLNSQIAPVFLHEILKEIEKGADLGLETREYEQSEKEPGVLLYSSRKNVSRAETVLDAIENSRKDIEAFNEYDHEFKNMRMIVAKFSKDNSGEEIKPFYVAKLISGNAALNERNSWQIDQDNKLNEFAPEVAFKIPTDNQVLIVDERIFAFDPGKFAKMFNYDFKLHQVAEKKIRIITERYKLTFPEGQTFESLISGRTKAVKILQKLDLAADVKPQEEIIEYACEMELGLMATDDGAIIIMDGHDVDTFVSLLNDDFMTSNLTGLKYKIGSKKLMEGE